MNDPEAPSAFRWKLGAEVSIEPEFFRIEARAAVEDGHAETFLLH